MSWPSDRPWSPILGKETDANGDEWYVHRDGSRSTTVLRYHTHLGRTEPVTMAAHPTVALPVAPGETGARQRTAAPDPGSKKGPRGN